MFRDEKPEAYCRNAIAISDDNPTVIIAINQAEAALVIVLRLAVLEGRWWLGIRIIRLFLCVDAHVKSDAKRWGCGPIRLVLLIWLRLLRFRTATAR